jgi:hypothetical protein
MKRPGQGHLHPKLEMGGEHSRKESFQTAVNSYSEHLHKDPRKLINFEYLRLFSGFTRHYPCVSTNPFSSQCI